MSGISNQLRDIYYTPYATAAGMLLHINVWNTESTERYILYSICKCCWNVATYKVTISILYIIVWFYGCLFDVNSVDVNSVDVNNISVISWRSVIFGGGNRRTRRKPPNCHKSLTNFITYCCTPRTDPWHTVIILCLFQH